MCQEPHWAESAQVAPGSWLVSLEGVQPRCSPEPLPGALQKGRPQAGEGLDLNPSLPHLPGARGLSRDGPAARSLPPCFEHDGLGLHTPAAHRTQADRWTEGEGFPKGSTARPFGVGVLCRFSTCVKSCRGRRSLMPPPGPRGPGGRAHGGETGRGTGITTSRDHPSC